MTTLWDELTKTIGFGATPRALRPLTFGTTLPAKGSQYEQMQTSLGGASTAGGDTSDTTDEEDEDTDDSQNMFGGLSKIFPFLLMMLFLFQFKGVNYQSSPEGTQFQFEYGRI